MIHAVQTGHPPPVSFAAEPPQAKAVPASQFSATAGRVAISEAFQRPDLQSPNYFSRLKTAILKQMLAQDSPITAKEKDGPPAKAPPRTSLSEGHATAERRPNSMAQSIVTARSDGAPAAVASNAETARAKKAEEPAPSPEPAEEAIFVPEMTVLTKGVQIPKLDAGWRIIPTAEFVDESGQEKLELMV